MSISVYIAIISNPRKLSGVLTKFFTGSPAYHIGFVDLAGKKFWDMNLLFRRRAWPHYAPENVKLYHCPVEITVADLEYVLDTDEDVYGWRDYMSFAFRGVAKRMGIRLKNHKGAICSEKVCQILQSKGWISPIGDVPSPADFEVLLFPY